ncbi:PHB depolymerase family esterase [Aliiglaciecola sp. LCG003]|uniref:extracellular catalytic domain type 2 short-chain-length polyhydroxyalkanoate depolymerase n=1 Tax=Aliiglaciecola sp. LCG003 TaxID=3053655 RepID=UPI0025723762|nr:PHB depolymerase family esterase [Aliiglaciecola sp. LCG003]WJG08040.1 PHB depolymerase family esterase [Aliiglaciecola sp. LCG003]
MKNLLLLALPMLVSKAFAGPLQQLDLDIEHISVSGISSGGFMANQFHLAHSKWVDKAAIIAAGPYYCAQGSIGGALSQCVNKVDTPIDLALLKQQAENYAKAGLIDAIGNLQHSKVWLFHGNKDTRVIAPVSEALFTQYSNWIKPENLKYISDKPFAHHFPTQKNGHQCDESKAPFIGKCNYDAAGEFLSFLFDSLKPASEKPSGQVVEFDQRELGGEVASTLAKTGYAYVPNSCSQGEQCTLHMSFHGCNQNAEAVDQQFIQQNGLNNWADSNHMVVLYPQTRASMMMPLNPQGCWDWWGYTGENYATKSGKQIQAVENIVKHMAK